MKKSPQQYIPKLTVLQPEDFSTLSSIPLVEINNVIIDKNEDGFPGDLKFGSLIVEKNDKIISDKFNSFLCENETFNWDRSNPKHYENIQYFTSRGNHRIHFHYLCNNFGNDITLFSRQYSDINYFQSYWTDYSNINRPYTVSIDETDEYERKINEIRIKFNLPYKYKYVPIVFVEEDIYIELTDKRVYTCYYVEEILKSKTRYALIQTRLDYYDGSHFVFLFADYQERKIEFYDPHGKWMNKNARNFVYSSLKELFKGFTINEFWKMYGIQRAEFLDPEIREGFCVIWGNMMAHLKLLNVSKSLLEIEKMFIEECKNKNLSLFEVMLNYSYTMSRIIPKDYEKYLKLESLLG
jgi:hypothetical protein